MPDPHLPPPPDSDRGASSPILIEPVTCLACGCLCDDLSVTLAGGTPVEVGNACEIARAWFLADRSGEEGLPAAEIDGRPAGFDEAVTRAADLLSASRAAVVLGLEGATNQAVASAAHLADRVGALVDPTSSPEDLARSVALARTGRVSATLGEVKNRADVVVFWGADPVRTHPRHWDRYSVTPGGRFVPGGEADRTVIVVDGERTATADRADRFVRLDRSREFEVFWTLRAMVKGVELDPDRVRRSAGIEPAELEALADELRGARYGALFFTSSPAGRSLTGSAAVLEAAQGLVRELNRRARFVILGMGGAGNRPGAEAVLAWQTGFPAAVDLGPGAPVSLPGVTTAAERLSRGEADLALLLGGSGFEALGRARNRIPTIVIAPHDGTAAGAGRVEVLCRAARPGLDEAGTVLRVDGVALPLRSLRPARFPTQQAWLGAIGRSLDDRVKR
jgi:formylmethanofuran dehydrogenase subunit B